MSALEGAVVERSPPVGDGSALLPPLEENLILRAGAGTGKTHALVTLALQLLAGLRQRGAVEADRLWLA
ncbi:MAG: hypothetical protein ACYCWW_17115, partial [Deltaproteobacteria bacterium]